MPALTLRQRLSYAFLLVLVLSLPACSAVGSIFKAGMWVGVVAVFAVLAIVVFVAGKLGGRGGA